MAPCAETVDIFQWRRARLRSGWTDSRTLNPAELKEAFCKGLELPAHLEPRLGAALRHLLERPGSMVRSRAAVGVARAFGVHPEAAEQLAIALEYFHTASLVFDDLPCMDNASWRRGAECVHVAFGESGAILAGLALVNRAYALTWQAIAKCPAGAHAAAAEYLEQGLGLSGLLNGQSLDLNYAQLPHTSEMTDRVASGKTVSLIRLTLVLPAILGEATDAEVRLLEHLADSWGLAYQILDDLRDLLQSATESGKTAARDLKLNRPNSALVLGIPTAVSRLEQLVQIGKRKLAEVSMMRPGLHFLERLHTDLEDELHGLMDRAVAARGGDA